MSTTTYQVARSGARVAAVGPRLTLTARGRRAVLGLVLGLATVLLVVLVGGGAARGQDAPQATVVVQEGDTLDSLAARYLPSTPRFEAVMMINRANHLNSTHVQAGRTLVIPAER